jgi:hypothetical protein
VDELKRSTTHLEGIKLKCRRDFEAHRQWPRWGFVAKGTSKGRGADNADLVIWHLDHHSDDLLSSIPLEKTLVAIDANVFFDLFLPDRPKRDISGALTEPWIDDIVELGLTSEIFNDIDRCADPIQRETCKAKARCYYEIRAAITKVDPIAAQLKKLYPDAQTLTAQDISDIRHVASAIIAEVKYFVTRDENLLAKSPDILQAFDIQLLSPSEFISRLDSIEREQEYQPLRLGASSITFKRPESHEIKDLTNSFRDPYEKISNFKNLLDACLSTPKTCPVHVALDGYGQRAVIIAIQKSCTDETYIPLIRISSQSIAKTVLRHLLMKSIVEAIQNHSRLIHITDPHVPRDAAGALAELGFRQTSSGWIKPLIKGFHAPDQIGHILANIGIRAIEHCSEKPLDELGTMIWPGKMVGEAMTAYLIPIQSQWAEHFFDVEVANQRFPDISGINDELHLGIEAVYYTATNIRFQAPGHILWYVSKGNEGFGLQQVKATSRLREVVKGTPKELFSRFRRLGVYQWKDLLAAANGNEQAQLTALRFSHTECFPLPLGADMLKNFNVRAPYPGPRPLPFATFQQIYNHGTNTTL